jgi:hypothetical protein
MHFEETRTSRSLASLVNVRARPPPALLVCVLAANAVAACGGGEQHDGIDGGAGGSGGAAGGGLGGSAFNQCGVAAPLPADTGQCTSVTAPTIADFDDYVTGTMAGSYTYYVNGKPPAPGAVLGAIQHIGDGSDMNGGTSLISTEMVTGEDGAGYALQIADTNAMHWGGVLLFYFPSSGATKSCLNGQTYGGVEFSIEGASPSGRFEVSLGMLDTIPVGDGGLCSNATASDCKNAIIDLPMPADATTWTKVQLPWSAFTPGVGSAQSCVPVTGQNIAQLSIQPLMSYPPPNYTFQPGPYTVAIDNVRFY